LIEIEFNSKDVFVKKNGSQSVMVNIKKSDSETKRCHTTFVRKRKNKD